MKQAADRASFGRGLRSSEIVGGALHLVLNNTIAAVEDGRLQLLDFLKPEALDERVVNRIEVVFEEVISNIVRHGFEPGSDQSIAVAAAVRPGLIDLTVEDDGAPFNPLEAPEPDRLTSLETAKLGGLGVALVRRLSVSVGYERLPADRARGDRAFRPLNRLTVSVATQA
jgi:serine/threonine-protein kinase RsbW